MSSDRFRGGEPRWNRGEFDQERGRYENRGERERYGRGDFEYREPFEQDRWGQEPQSSWGRSFESSRGFGRGFSQPQADGEPYDRGARRGERDEPYERYGAGQSYADPRKMREGDARESRSYGTGRAEYSENAPSSYGRGSSVGSPRSSERSMHGDERWRPSDRYDGYDRSFEPGGGRLDRRMAPTSTRGRFTGKGPKGYHRSDERIKEDVSEALSHDGELDASEIEVTVAQGEVTLEGSVPDRESKRRAEDLSEDLPGVKQIHNRLRVDNSHAIAGKEGASFGSARRGAGATNEPSPKGTKTPGRSTI